MQKSSRSSGHQSSRHRTRDKSRDRDQERDRDRDKDWPPEKLSDSHSPVSVQAKNKRYFLDARCFKMFDSHMLVICVMSLSESATEVTAQTPAPFFLVLQPDRTV